LQQTRRGCGAKIKILLTAGIEKKRFMDFSQRLEVLARLQDYMLGNDESWLAAKEKAYTHNAWFIPEFIDLAVKNIADLLLNPSTLQQWAETYNFSSERQTPATIGVIMAGNIPLAGFFQFLSIFLAGHKQRIRLSAKDEVLLPHLVRKMISWNAAVEDHVSFEEMLKGCDAYAAALDNNASPQFERYFGKYPLFVYRASSSAAVLTGNEDRSQLELLADDVFRYFGRGCMNVTRLYVPRNFDFIPVIKAFDKYRYLIDHNKYKNNYDYQLALLILNKRFYMTNGCILLTENETAAAPVAMLFYSYYDNLEDVNKMAGNNRLVGIGYEPAGKAGESVKSMPSTQAVLLLQFLRDL
jgi:hypothetical protein